MKKINERLIKLRYAIDCLKRYEKNTLRYERRLSRLMFEEQSLLKLIALKKVLDKTKNDY